MKIRSRSASIRFIERGARERRSGIAGIALAVLFGALSVAVAVAGVAAPIAISAEAVENAVADQDARCEALPHFAAGYPRSRHIAQTLALFDPARGRFRSQPARPGDPPQEKQQSGDASDRRPDPEQAWPKGWDRSVSARARFPLSDLRTRLEFLHALAAWCVLHPDPNGGNFAKPSAACGFAPGETRRYLMYTDHSVPIGIVNCSAGRCEPGPWGGGATRLDHYECYRNFFWEQPLKTGYYLPAALDRRSPPVRIQGWAIIRNYDDRNFSDPLTFFTRFSSVEAWRSFRAEYSPGFSVTSERENDRQLFVEFEDDRIVRLETPDYLQLYMFADYPAFIRAGMRVLALRRKETVLVYEPFSSCCHDTIHVGRLKGRMNR